MLIQPDRNPNPTPDFRVGDALVVLYQGLYNGMAGTFAGPTADANWALVREENGAIRSHPIAWMRRPVALATPPAGYFSTVSLGV